MERFLKALFLMATASLTPIWLFFLPTGLNWLVAFAFPIGCCFLVLNREEKRRAKIKLTEGWEVAVETSRKALEWLASHFPKRD